LDLLLFGFTLVPQATTIQDVLESFKLKLLVEKMYVKIPKIL
jgi:hypothetical protein